jgi:hypothetical protein
MREPKEIRMAGYLALRKLRRHLWIAFVVALLLAISLMDLDASLWEYTRYLPLSFLLIALAVGFVERKLRVHWGA